MTQETWSIIFIMHNVYLSFFIFLYFFQSDIIFSRLSRQFQTNYDANEIHK